MATATKEVAKRLPKPILRGLLVRHNKKHFALAVGLAVINATLFKVFYINPKVKAYEDYYKNLDVDAKFQRMKSKGVFQSCPAD